MTELSQWPGYPAPNVTIYDREHNVGFSSLFFVSAGLTLIAALLLYSYMRARVKRLKASATM
jgi:hypothetical protein